MPVLRLYRPYDGEERAYGEALSEAEGPHKALRRAMRLALWTHGVWIGSAPEGIEADYMALRAMVGKAGKRKRLTDGDVAAIGSEFALWALEGQAPPNRAVARAFADVKKKLIKGYLLFTAGGGLVRPQVRKVLERWATESKRKGAAE